MLIVCSQIYKRAFSTRSSRSLQKFLSPTEYLEKTEAKKLEDRQFQETLLNTPFEYSPQTLSSRALKDEGRPVPLNVELLKYKPLRLRKTHGDEVCQLFFRGYEEPELARMGEFAARAAYYLGIPMSPLTSLKTEKRLYTVIKSPFAQAKTKQNFHRITYNKKLIAYDANDEVVDMWLSYVNKYKLPQVEMKATITSREKLSYNEDLQNAELEFPLSYEGIEDPVALKMKELLESEEFKRHLK